MTQIGLVAIGRNEGERLRQCLLSVIGRVNNIIYVDSGSTDESVAIADSLMVETIDLDLSIPYTAGRARNEGFKHLLQINPEIEFVQFVDGDCEVVDGWMDLAQAALRTRPELAIVYGRTRERFPELSLYNRLCDMEWDTPIGETKTCGGIAMMRVSAFQQVSGFKSRLRAGEEPELCVRLRQAGWQIWKLEAEMALHDAQMTQFRQWWQRTVRSGHAYAEGAWLHGSTPDFHWVRESLSISFWGLILPMCALGLGWVTHGLGLWLFVAYPILTSRIFIQRLRKQVEYQDAILYAMACVAGKFPQVIGMLDFLQNQLRMLSLN